MNQPTNPLDALLPVIAQAVADWQINHTPDVLKKRVTELLDESREEIVYKLLGFNRDGWEGKWSLDHCNGRSGESAAGDYLRQVQADAIKEWLASVPMPTITAKMLVIFKKQYQAEFDNRIASQMRKHIEQEADSRAAELFNKLSQSTQVDSFVEMMKLITPEGTVHAS